MQGYNQRYKNHGTTGAQSSRQRQAGSRHATAAAGSRRGGSRHGRWQAAAAAQAWVMQQGLYMRVRRVAAWLRSTPVPPEMRYYRKSNGKNNVQPNRRQTVIM